MPRPSSTAERPAEDQRYPRVTLDAPDAYYSMVEIKFQDGHLWAFDLKGQQVGVYPLDRDPEISHDDIGRPTIVASTAGAPLVARFDTGCACHGTRKALKR